ncbi:MAG: ATP-dependent helicase HrpB [Victivallales bacterium]|nr:ATP-dependent helicase HrpB [Victivallales bacterium]
MPSPQLPIFEAKERIVAALAKQGTAIITAPTGSGKSTQVPRFLLDLTKERILVLQPRRIAARMLAERVASEMGENVGGMVGFHTRYERAFSKETRILFLTEGILTRMLADSPSLPGIGAVIFDEYHERSLNTDLGLAMAWHSKKTLRNELLIVVMSATMEAKPVSEFMDNAPIVNSQGRLFDVDISYCTQAEKMEGPAIAASKALRNLLASGAQGDVLIFMPGGREIRQTMQCLEKMHFNEPLDIMPLYGDLPPDEQRRVMQPSSLRKVIVATNIAETSLTIPGVRHVIDSGYARMAKYDSIRGVDVLDTVPIAIDAADQRAGRAGREAAGTCCRLWSWLEQSAKFSRTIPEIHRVDLAEAVLAINSFGFNDAASFPWFEKPNDKALLTAVRLLERLGATKPDNGGITELGRKLLSIPAHPRLALLLWLGSQSGCINLAALAVGLLSARPIMLNGAMPRRRKSSANSDFLVLIDTLETVRNARFAADFCGSLGVNPAAVREVCRIADDCLSSAKRAHWQTNDAPHPETAFMQCLLRVFPDRLGRRIPGKPLCELQNGRHGKLLQEDAMPDDALFIATEMREGPNGQLVLAMTSQIQEDWLLDFFPDDWKDVDEAFWDENKQQVLRRQELYCLDLRLEEKTRNDPAPEKAAQILVELLAKGKLQMPYDTAAADRWIARTRWVAEIFPERNLPDYADKTPAFAELCYGETSAKSLKGKDYFSAIKNMLTREQQIFVEKMAPEIIVLPNGRRMKVEYAPGTTPKGRSRIQDFYDLPDSPKVAGGRVRILLDILAPNNRTVQITDDLANFWKVLYPKIKPELSRRYPRHLWK